MSRLARMYHEKQRDVLKFALNNDFFMLINHGAKRTGKTIINNDLFLLELKRVRKIADDEGVKDPQYILAGADLGAIQRNVLNELSNKYELEFKFDKHNRFRLFGVLVCCFGHSKINDLGRIRGMTAYGAYINECSIANEEVFNEIKSRCSGTGARLLIDTNPDQPEHWLKRDYIDKADGKLIQAYQYQLDDNTFLSDRYRDSIKSSTPTGVFYDRDILGMWVSAEGIVYRDFDMKKHYVDELPSMTRYFAGIDWGYDHYGCIVVIGEGVDGNYYYVDEVAKKHQEIDYWVDVANKIKGKYGNIRFYADTARPEHIVRFKREGINVKSGTKRRLAGIEAVASLFKQDKLLIYKPVANLFRREIFMYAWNEKTGDAIKQWDDCMDALRYAIYSDKIVRGGV